MGLNYHDQKMSVLMLKADPERLTLLVFAMMGKERPHTVLHV